MRSLITGMGFAGYHLAELLLKLGHEVLGLSIVQHFMLPEHNAFNFQISDVTDSDNTREVIEAFDPDYVFHLAAQSSVARSWQEPRQTIETNIHGAYNVMQVVNELDKPVSVHIACSSDEYGKVSPEELPLTEEHPLRPSSPYALSKVFQDYVGIFFAQTCGINVFRTRAFNHTGPGQAPNFVCSDFAKQIAEIEKGLQEPVIRVGNLEAKRDFTDVRDVVAAYWDVVSKGKPGEIYNICSGRSYAISKILDELINMSTVDIKIMHDPDKDRPSDIPELRGDYSRLRDATGWEPRIEFEQTLADILKYWRTSLAVSAPVSKQ